MICDFDKVNQEVQLRKWKNGDWFCPIGMKGNKKKVSDYLIDEKVPLPSKDKTLVFQSGNSLLWLVGMRPDERFKIAKDTTKVLQITVLSK